MNPEDVKILIDQLLKTGEFLATKGFEIALRQNYAYATADLAAFLVFLIVGIKLLKFAEKKYSENEYGVDWIYIGLLALFSFAISTVELTSSFLRFVSPEWYAIKDLINLVR